MSFAKVNTRALLGIESPEVVVEVHASRGLPSLQLVGLPETSVKESRERVRSALMSAGFELPPMRITVNLAPADLPKTGGRYDLAIAVGILVATQQLQWDDLAHYELYGELSLDGALRPSTGILPSLIKARQANRTACIAQSSSTEAQLVFSENRESSVLPLVFASLAELVQWRMGMNSANSLMFNEARFEDFDYPCMSDVKGQLQAKRVLEVCASGGHSLMMIGPPGAGKSMLASRLVGILPPLTNQEALEVAAIQSLTKPLTDMVGVMKRPYQHPHHSSSAAALIGGGSFPKPGAISLSHQGILFLDELPEFHRNSLEALREPLETGRVEIARVQQHISFPAKCQLITALNPTPSGYFPDDPKGRCKDTPNQIQRYLKKISGPLLDRIDCHIEVPALDVHSLQSEQQNSEKSSTIRERVTQVRSVQLHRQGCLNADLDLKSLQSLIVLDEGAKSFLHKVVNDLGLSARAYHRLLKVALTLADMEQQTLSLTHLAEALSYRQSQKITDLL